LQPNAGHRIEHIRSIPAKAGTIIPTRRAVQHLGVLAPIEQRLAYQVVEDRPLTFV
jgi:hypothetical protein